MLGRKGQTPVSMLTCYDYNTARTIDEAGVDMILVGDSLGNVMLGYENTLAVGESGDPVTDYLSGMKEKDQLLLVLKFQENLREADIASVLHIPRGTVSSRINTLLGRIREQMSKEGLSCD